MKKICLFLAVCICIISCDVTKKLPTIPRDEVVRMYNHYYDVVKLHPELAIGQVTINRPEMKKVLRGIKFINFINVADRSDKFNVVVQLHKHDNSKFYYIDVLFPNNNKGGALLYKTYCPPPDPCSIPLAP